MTEYLDKKYLDYEQSFKVFKSLLTTNYEIDSYPPKQATNETFGTEFPGALIHKPSYQKCSFIASRFEASDGALSKFHECQFVDCLFNNCDLRYCDIFNSKFFSDQKAQKILSCNFSYGNFVDATFEGIEFNGCSFRQMQFENVAFKNCIMEYSSIEQTSIKNCIFENVDLKKVGVRYCTFENVVFSSTTFHILDLPRNYGLIELLKNNPDNNHIAYSNGKEMSLNAALTTIKALAPYYYETNQFYELFNILIVYKEYDEILNILPYAFENVISAYDFAALQDLCSLIVRFNIFSVKQLRQFYTIIKQLIIPDSFPYYLRKSYNSYIENIKNILIDNPYNNPRAQILLKTDIETLADPDMKELLYAIETNVNELAPGIDSSLQLTKHSPYDVIIDICGQLPTILMICQIFYYSLGGTKAFDDIKNKRTGKTSNQMKNKKQNDPKGTTESIKRIELSVGNIFTFKYEKEYTKRVKSMEYTIL